MAVAVAVLAVLVGAVSFLRWWTHPTVFGGLGDSFATSGPRPVADAALSTTVVFPRVDGEPETVTIDRAEAVFAANTAEATVSFSICHLGADEDPIGSVDRPEKYCADVVPLEPGARFRHGVPDSDYLFATIAPTRAGVAHLAEIELTYQRGAGHLYQRGTETIRVDRKVTAE